MTGTVIVTGGSRGIGAATAVLAAKRGYAVAINYRGNQKAADDVIGTIEGAGGKAIAIKGNVADDADIARLFDEAEQKLGPIVGLVNNAGITGKAGKLTDMSAETMREVFEINIVGAFLAAREAVKRMSTARGGKGGSIVNLSSIAAFLGGPGEWTHYAASKGAIETFTIGLSKEVAREGIRVNAVAPGLIDTEIHATAGYPDRVERLAPTVPMGRGGTADEVAEAILWLLSDQASYVTGTSIRCSGGR